MTLSSAEAQAALKDIEKTESRSAASLHARASSPYLMLWGVIWAIGYTATAAAPEIKWVWLVLVIAGIVGSVLLSMGRASASGRGSDFGLRYFASFGVIAAFVGALTSILPPTNINQVSAIAPLVIGVFYAVIGMWSKGWRMLPLGLALIGLTTFGYFALPEHFLYWMAGVGGGGLILGGLWMRTV